MAPTLPLGPLPQSQRPPGWEIVRATLRFVLMVVFLAAAVPKVLDPAAFLGSIEGFRLVPRGVAWLLAFWLPWLEAIAAVGLLVPAAERAARLLLASLLVLFISALGLAAWRGINVDCGCFGASGPGTTTALGWAIARNLVLLAAIAACGRRQWPPPAAPPAETQPGSTAAQEPRSAQESPAAEE